ncbi:MAG: LLM class F420-dependent oxidoreductase [Gammaproteobacteria bacterium]|nr:LLM class F420-dependent oxidoreductase [Gammaproteobacteria bacterium]RPG25272.1 MAG: LLM class F420-dependent oxidoreductase [Gammaproteobacteria bacterium TMED50]|tara:strand:+ start:5067 stop:5909 length:843 start_codon:yes stop_codon:yes gene_type:complete
MKFGLFGINNGVCGDPAIMMAVSRQAESRGFESVWTGEHVVLPDPQVPPSPAPPLMDMVHPPVALAYIAGCTETLKLGTGIALLAQRNPVVLAKEMAGLDFVSRGRLIMGIGAGYLKAEFDALGIDFSARGARSDECIDVMRELWTSDNPTFDGRFTRFSGIQSRPQPVSPGGPPIVVGGSSDAALRRAVTRCQGWYGFALNEEQTKDCLDRLAAMAEKHPRPESLGPLEISVSPRVRMNDDVLAAFEDMGVHRLILLQSGQTQDALLQFVDDTADAFIR